MQVSRMFGMVLTYFGRSLNKCEIDENVWLVCGAPSACWSEILHRLTLTFSTIFTPIIGFGWVTHRHNCSHSQLAMALRFSVRSRLTSLNAVIKLLNRVAAPCLKHLSTIIGSDLIPLQTVQSRASTLLTPYMRIVTPSKRPRATVSKTHHLLRKSHQKHQCLAKKQPWTSIKQWQTDVSLSLVVSFSYTHTRAVNEARAMRIAEVMNDFQMLQQYLMQTQPNPPVDDYYEEGYELLRQCRTAAQAVLSAQYDHEPQQVSGGAGESEKRQLQR